MITEKPMLHDKARSERLSTVIDIEDRWVAFEIFVKAIHAYETGHYRSAAEAGSNCIDIIDGLIVETEREIDRAEGEVETDLRLLHQSSKKLEECVTLFCEACDAQMAGDEERADELLEKMNEPMDQSAALNNLLEKRL